MAHPQSVLCSEVLLYCISKFSRNIGKQPRRLQIFSSSNVIEKIYHIVTTSDFRGSAHCKKVLVINFNHTSFGNLSCIPFVYMTQSSKSAQNLNRMHSRSFPLLLNQYLLSEKNPSIFGELCCLFDLAHLLIESSLVAWLRFTIPGM